MQRGKQGTEKHCVRSWVQHHRGHLVWNYSVFLIDICFVSAKKAALTIKGNYCWDQKYDNVSEMIHTSTSGLIYDNVSEMIHTSTSGLLYDNVSKMIHTFTSGLLFQWASAIKIHLKRVCLVQSGNPHRNVTLVLSYYVSLRSEFRVVMSLL